MKKFLLLLVSVTALSVEGFAQKGMNSVGVEIPVGVGKHKIWTGIGVKYQYNISDYIQVEPSFSYFPIYSSGSIKEFWAEGESRTEWQALANFNFFVQSPRTVRPFFIVGGGVSYWKNYTTYQSGNRDGNTISSFTFSAGLGLDIRIAYHWSMQLKAAALIPVAGGEWMSNGRIVYNGGIGLCYNF